MQVYVSNREIEQIAKGLVQTSLGHPPPRFINIDAIARYLHFPVVYEDFAEKDPDKIGFVSDGQKALLIIRNGRKCKIRFKKDTIILDRFLLRPEEEYRRRFTLAHEISHILINRADPGHSGACFNRVYDTERTYSIEELRERLSLGECQANSMAAMILMPYEVLADSVNRHFHRATIPVYGDCVFLPKIKPVLQQMSKELGVSFTAIVIQLRKYNLLENRDMSEYFIKTISNGGV